MNDFNDSVCVKRENTGTDNEQMKKKLKTQSVIDARQQIVETDPVQPAVRVEGVNEGKSVIASNNDKEYVAWKMNFERDWCKIRNTETFIGSHFENGVLKICIRRKGKLCVSYKEQCYMKTLHNGKEKRVAYISEWVKDPNIRCYEDVGVYPPPLTCPPHIYNLWNCSPHVFCKNLPLKMRRMLLEGTNVEGRKPNVFLRHALRLSRG